VVKDKKIENLEKSSVKLTLTIDKKAVKSEYDDLMKKYSKTAQLKGFRKGKVPPAMLEKKFGESIRAEASMNSIENSLKDVFEEIDEKPLPYHTPELQEDVEFDLEKDLKFSVVYDTFPAITLGDYKGLEIESPDVSITKEDQERELKTIQEQNAMVAEKKEGVVAEGDIATIDYEELDEEGKPKPGSKREGFVFTVGTGYNLYKLDDDIIGMKKDEEKEINKEFPEDYEIAELKGKSIKLNVKVTAVKEKQMPELDDELAQDISEKYKTLDDLKKDIKAKLKEASKQKIKEKNIAALMDKIIENSPIDLPQSMIDIELESSWQNFVQQFRAQEQEVIQLLAEQGKTKEQLLEEWIPTTEKKIKNRLLMTKIIEEEKIEITDNDIEEEIKHQSEAGNVPLEDMKKRFESERMKEYLRGDLADRKLFDLLLEATTITKGKKVKFLDLMQDKQ